MSVDRRYKKCIYTTLYVFSVYSIYDDNPHGNDHQQETGIK